jgi:hypothetical protein
LQQRREQSRSSDSGVSAPSATALDRPAASTFSAFQADFLMNRLAATMLQALGGSLPGRPVFDCGSGEGRLAEALLARLSPANSQLILVDVDHGAVARGVRRMADRHVRGICGDLEALPVRPSARSVFVLCHALYYVRDRERVLRDLLFRHSPSVVVVVVRDADCLTARLWRHVTGGGRRATNSAWMREFIWEEPNIEGTETENITDVGEVLVDLAQFMMNVDDAPVTSGFVEAVVYRSPTTDQALHAQSVDFFSRTADLVIREHVFVLRALRSAE